MWDILNKPNSENYYFYFPMIFCAFLFSFPLIFFFKFYNILYISVCMLFLFIAFVETLRIMDRVNNFFSIYLLLIVCTLSPGFGILAGLIFNFKQK